MLKKWSFLALAAAVTFGIHSAWAQDEGNAAGAAVVQPDYAGNGMHRGNGPRHDSRGGPRMGRGGMRHAGGMRMGRGDGMGGMFGMHQMHDLNLTVDQRKQMIDIMTNNFRDCLLARMEMSDGYGALAELEKSENPNHDAIIAANQTIGAARGKLDVLGRKFRDDMKAILTAEQAKKFEDLRNQHDDAPDGEGNRGGHPGGHKGMGGMGMGGGCMMMR